MWRACCWSEPKAESRKRETVLRGVLGASVGRLIRQFVTEGVLLVTVAVALGMPAASAAIPRLFRLIPERRLRGMPYFRDRRAASACAAVHRRGFAAGSGGVLFGAGFAPIAYQTARGPWRRRARLGGNIMEAFRVKPGGGGTGDRDGAAG